MSASASSSASVSIWSKWYLFSIMHYACTDARDLWWDTCTHWRVIDNLMKSLDGSWDGTFNLR